jgi:hypothetical protein
MRNAESRYALFDGSTSSDTSLTDLEPLSPNGKWQTQLIAGRPAPVS